MINDYTGNVLHDARHRDRVNEARGVWLLKQAREEEPAAGQRNLIQLSAPRTGCADRSAVSSTLIYVR